MEKLISEFSLGLFFWQSAIFIGLLFLLRKFAWKPILNAVNEREASIINALDSAKEARTQLENLQSENQRLLKEARKEKEILLKEALKTKNQIISDAKKEAQNETEKILSQAQETIQSEKRAALKAAGDYEGLQRLPKNASPIRMHNRCKITGRPKGYMRQFGISRVMFREMANFGFIPGVKKASW